MDERVVAVRQEIEAGSASPQALVLPFNAASDAELAGDILRSSVLRRGIQWSDVVTLISRA